MASVNDLGVITPGGVLDANAGAGWSSEYTVVECRELQVTAMCVDSSGTRALLAGRRVTAIVALDQLELTSTDARIPNNTRASQASALTSASTAVSVHQRSGKYDVTAAEWCPLDAQHAALAINQRVELLDVGMTGIPRITHQLNAHARVVTDLHWHRTDHNVLATCSADTFTHVWDVREPRRPALSLAAVAEASQVRWNAIRESVLATAHDGDVKVWDRRQTTQPVHYIAAHVAKIHGVQWSPHDEHELATCSQDGTVKLWHVQQPRRPHHCLATSQPVWRVRYTPFGRGLVTVVLPAQLRRTQHDHSLLLWNMHSRTQPQHAFVGHEDVVLEFDWRKSLPVGNDDHQLVTWAKDGTLRVWRVDLYLQKLCGHVPHSSVVSSVPEDGRSTSVSVSSPPVHTLQQEFSLLNLNIQGVDILEIDPIARTCAVSVATLVGTQEIGKKIIVRAFFPAQYPIGVAPEFTVTPDTPNGDLIRALQSAAHDRVARSRTCLEPCLRRLVNTLDQLSEQQEQRDHGAEEALVVSSESSTNQTTPVTSLSPPFGSYDDGCIPFPRTCGARFCSVDMLVCFVRTPSNYRRSVQSNSSTGKDGILAPTPRSLSALASVNGDVSISSFYYQERKHRSKTTSGSSSTRHRIVANPAFRPTVTTYCASGLFPLNRWLGERYRLDGSAIVACRHNASAAATAGRTDLLHVWRTAELAARFQAAMTASILANGSDNCDDGASWTHHPFGKRLVHSLVAHYAERGDLQTAAVLSCIFSRTNGTTASNLCAELQSRAVTVSKGNVYHTVGPSSQPADIACTAESWSQAQLKPQNQQPRRRSLDRLPMVESGTVTDSYRWRDLRSTSFSQQESLHQSYKLAYAEVLHRWGLLYARADLLKHAPSSQITINGDQHQYRGVEFVTECSDCGERARDAHCSRCRRYAFSCAVCRVSVRGSANFCLVCGHGGHAQHVRDWFGAGNQTCPTGCGCSCLRETASLISAH